MRIKLKRIELLASDVIDAMSRDELIELTKLLQERMGTYQDYLFRVRRQAFGKKSEKSAGNNTTEDPPPKPPKDTGFVSGYDDSDDGGDDSDAPKKEGIVRLNLPPKPVGSTTTVIRPKS